jgi:polyhydroxybutyrate depolymerase
MTVKPGLKRGFLLTFVIAAITLLTAAPAAAQGLSQESYGGRSLYVYVPPSLPPLGARALVVVLHGGLGNAGRIVYGKSENALNMDSAAEKNGFIVAYLNGTKVARLLRAIREGWNAGGGCCGLPAENNVNDVGYIEGAVGYLAGKYGINCDHIFGIGHSNGAMMTQRVMCQTGLYAAEVAISGPLNLSVNNCPAARGKRILAIHGAEDENVPVAGGRGTRGLSRAVYNSEAQSKQVFANSGASYDLQIVPGADHYLNHIEAVVEKTEGQTIAEKAAKFFGLSKK